MDAVRRDDSSGSREGEGDENEGGDEDDGSGPGTALVGMVCRLICDTLGLSDLNRFHPQGGFVYVCAYGQDPHSCLCVCVCVCVCVGTSLSDIVWSIPIIVVRTIVYTHLVFTDNSNSKFQKLPHILYILAYMPSSGGVRVCVWVCVGVCIVYFDALI